VVGSAVVVAGSTVADTAEAAGDIVSPRSINDAQPKGRRRFQGRGPSQLRKIDCDTLSECAAL
jgi:hypothetical protein